MSAGALGAGVDCGIPGSLAVSSLHIPRRYPSTLIPGRLDGLYEDLQGFYYKPIAERLAGLVPLPAQPDTSVYRLCRRVYRENLISGLLDTWENFEDDGDLFDTLMTEICFNSLAQVEEEDPFMVATSVFMDRDLFQATTIFLMHFFHLKRPLCRIRCGLWMLTALTSCLKRISKDFPELGQVAKSWADDNVLWLTASLHDHCATTADAKYFDNTGHPLYRNRDVEHRGVQLVANGVLTGRTVEVKRQESGGKENYQIAAAGQDKPFLDIERDFVKNPASKGSSIAKDLTKLSKELELVIPVPAPQTPEEIDEKIQRMTCRMDMKLQLKEGRTRKDASAPKRRKVYQPSLAALPFDTRPIWLATRAPNRLPAIKDAEPGSSSTLPSISDGT
ncbi:hypothetical protein FOL47_001935 [Perkinsus chesapeaki]|uniref:Uncharacterized protein n=1 Tax=Perkinsus chesapeaki TaxID=330153 RepID=A0A7J6KSP5_PERCH|nr:hypothetical protein FOL47_001935 [Perkinsus chesapeaki]